MSEPARLSPEQIQEKIDSVSYWFHRIEVAPGIFTPGINDTPKKMPYVGLPESLEGKRVLDVGPADGAYSFECERRGAREVLAVGPLPRIPGFEVARDILGSNVQYKQISVYELSTSKLGTFDIVLFMGVLYHLRHPLLALDCLHDMFTDFMVMETYVSDIELIDEDGNYKAVEKIGPELNDYCMAQFFPTNELNNDPSNWWGPNEKCLKRALETGGYEVTYSKRWPQNRIIVHCRRKKFPEGTEFSVASLLKNRNNDRDV